MSASARQAWTSPFRYLVVTGLLLFVGGIVVVFAAIAFRLDMETIRRAIVGSASEETWFAIRLTAVCTTITTAIAVAIAIPAGYALSRYKFPLHSVIDTIIDLPIVLPPLVAGIALLVFFGSTAGVWIEKNIMPFVYTQQGIILAQLVPAGSFAVRAIKAAFDSVHPRMEQVARTLGCNERQAFIRVVLPQARNGLVAGAVMTWARAAGEFGPILMFCGATRMKTETLPIAVFLNMSVGDVGMALSLTVILVVLSAAALLVFKALGGRGYLW
jgi:molybdate transport system permease protein